jgi:hypothetical protein
LLITSQITSVRGILVKADITDLIMQRRDIVRVLLYTLSIHFYDKSNLQSYKLELQFKAGLKT